MEEPTNRLPSALPVVRVALAVFVLAWILGPYALRSAVPVWIAFLVALGVELHFFVGALRLAPARRADRGPQAVDRERYGFAGESDELLLVREEGEDIWIPYSGETEEEVESLIAEARERGEDDIAAPVDEDGGLGPPVRRFLVGLAVIGALAVTLGVVESRTGWNALDSEARAAASERFSDEASRIADKRVTIHCDESGDYVGAVQHADGVAAVGGEFAFLTPERCFDLYRLAFKGEVTSSQTARALAVLAHEAWHLRGVRDEGTTECYALQTGVALGQRLGLSEKRARQLMRLELTENALRARGSAEYLVPPDCREGGRLDLDPESTRFP